HDRRPGRTRPRPHHRPPGSRALPPSSPSSGHSVGRIPQSSYGGSFSGPSLSISATRSSSLYLGAVPLGCSLIAPASTISSTACPSSRRKSSVTAFGSRTAGLFPQREILTCIDHPPRFGYTWYIQTRGR